MKRIICLVILAVLLAGCGSPSTKGEIVLPYPKPADFSHFEVFVGTAPGFPVTGWSGLAWTGSPNAPADWDGTTNTLKVISATEPIVIPNLAPGVLYYVRVVGVDLSYNRSAPSPEYSCSPGETPRAATLVVAAADASDAAKAGADHICDGVDDQDEINAALAALPAGGGSVMLTEGLFLVSDSIVLPSNCVLSGQGGSTIIKVAAAMTDDTDVIINSDTSGGNTKITVKNLYIDGNRDEGGSNAHVGIKFNKITNASISGVYIEDIYGGGINILYGEKIKIDNVNCNNCGTITGGGVGVWFNNCAGCILSGSVVSYCGNGIYMDYSTQCIIANNVSSYSLSSGINVNQFNSGCTVVGNTCFSNNYDGLSAYDSQGINIQNNICYNNKLHGIRVGSLFSTSDDCLISGNNCYENSQETDDTYSNIIIVSEGNNNNIQGNTCRRGDGANQPKYGIRVDASTCENNTITNNDCYTGGKTAGVSDAGTGTIFGPGNRDNDGAWSGGIAAFSWVEPGDTVLLEALAERSTTNTTGVTIKTFQVDRPGRYRVTCELRGGSSSTTATAWLTALGQRLSSDVMVTGTTYAVRTLDMGIPLGAGAQFDVMLKSFGASAFILNCRVQFEEVLAATPAVITN